MSLLGRRSTGDILHRPTISVARPASSEPVSVDWATPPRRTLPARLTRPFNLTGQPAVSVPCGFTGSGMPIGMKVATRTRDEAMALRVAHTYQ